MLGYEVRYAGMTSDLSDRDNKLRLDVYDPQKQVTPLFTAMPGVHKISMPDGQESTMVVPFIQRGILKDTYLSLGQPQTSAGQDIQLKAGEDAKFGGLTLKYLEMTRKGEFGMKGTKFGAKVQVSGGGKTDVVNPEMEIGEGGTTVPHSVKLDKNLELVMAGMNAADKSVTLRVQLTTPLYPVEIYHKPMTILVWLGTAILTVSGLLAAYYRRFRHPVKVGEKAKAQPKIRRVPEPALMKGEIR